MAVFDEETFGPVAAITKADDAAHALQLANQSIFGLGAAVWTQSEQTANWFIHHLEAGAVFVNEMVKSDPRLPFGGLKQSGYGNELSYWGMYEFMNLKSVWRQ
jgi:succinate-semialdehyde dehydrogenase/glutarate-semialdehyde dehydrogenase